jgi:transposase-like protein
MNTPLQGLENEIIEQRKSGATLQSIANKYGVTRQGIHLLIKKAEKEGKIDPWERKEKEPKNCTLCSTPFIPKTKKQKTCSKECAKNLSKMARQDPTAKWSRLGKIKLTCHRCGTPFERTNYHQSISFASCSPNKKNYCSKKCYCKYISENKSSKSNRKYTYGSI